MGRWQKRSDLLLWLQAMAAGMAANIALFPQPQQDPYGEFRCRTGCDVGEDFNFADWNPEERFPSFDNNSDSYSPDSPDYCRYYNSSLVEGTCMFDKNTTLYCRDGYEFTGSVSKNVCSTFKNYWGQWASIGSRLGAFIFGLLADRIGRRRSLRFAVVLCCGGSLIGIGIKSYWGHGVLTIITSFGKEGIIMLAYTLVLEYSGVQESIPCTTWAKKSTTLFTLVGLAFALGKITPLLVKLVVVNNW